MHDNIRKQWVDKLRSGEYPQGTGNLRSNDNFCCLGVLCELAVEQNVIGPAILAEGSESLYVYVDEKAEDEYDAWLPPAVKKWAGLQTSEVLLAKPQPIPSHVAPAKSLTSMNDNGATFAQIADFIESDDFEEAVDKSK
jgi:hypothetical protein